MRCGVGSFRHLPASHDRRHGHLARVDINGADVHVDRQLGLCNRDDVGAGHCEGCWSRINRPNRISRGLMSTARLMHGRHGRHEGEHLGFPYHASLRECRCTASDGSFIHTYAKQVYAMAAPYQSCQSLSYNMYAA